MMPESKADQRELITVGDQLQSAGSRVAEWVKQHQLDVPYEVDMAALELASAVKWWTELRAAAHHGDPYAALREIAGADDSSRMGALRCREIARAALGRVKVNGQRNGPLKVFSLRVSLIGPDGQRESRWFLWGPDEFENELASVIRHGSPVFVEVHP